MPRRPSARAFLLLPAALYVSSIAVVAVHDGGAPSDVHAVADPTLSTIAAPAQAPTPLATPSSVPPSSASALPITVVGPASVTRARQHDPATTGDILLPAVARRAVTADVTPQADATLSGIGTSALAAYQRAASVIDNADTTCRLDWTLLAAIGDVESAHGTYGGSTLSPAGVATPAIDGPVLDGRHHTTLVADTDGGRLDGDARYDRAIGPMQILPATWLQIAVDGDGDGRRDPQDINDAALAAAVYLCSDGSDLSTPDGARTAVLRYNHSASYAATVLDLAASYLQGEATSAAGTLTGVVTVVSGPGDITPAPAQPDATAAPRHHDKSRGSRPHGPAQAHHLHQLHHAHLAPAHDAGAGAALHTMHASPPPGAPVTGVAVPGTSSGPSTDVPTGAPTGAPSDEPATPLPDAMCREAVVTAYPTAPDDVVDTAVAVCVRQLDGRTDEQARTVLPGLIARLPMTVDGLATPAPSPADDPSASAEPSATASDESTAAADAP